MHYHYSVFGNAGECDAQPHLFKNECVLLHGCTSLRVESLVCNPLLERPIQYQLNIEHALLIRFVF